MKEKIDFVTNSSSVSYVICVPDSIKGEELQDLLFEKLDGLEKQVEDLEDVEDFKEEWKKFCQIFLDFFNPKNTDVELEVYQGEYSYVTQTEGFWEICNMLSSLPGGFEIYSTETESDRGAFTLIKRKWLEEQLNKESKKKGI